MKKSIQWFWLFISAVGLGLVLTGPTLAADLERSWGQLVFVPVYPSVYIDERGRDLNMTSSLMIRNVDPALKIRVLKADLHDADGKQTAAYLTEPATLGPLASIRLLVKQGKERTRLEGASFLVEWEAAGDAALPPIVEDITIGAEGTQGISFVQSGRVISEKSQE